MLLPPELEQRFKDSANYGLDRWAARQLFRAVGLTDKKSRFRLLEYYLKLNKITSRDDRLAAAVLAVRRVLQVGYGPSVVPISEFLTAKAADDSEACDWYAKLYPEWTGLPPAMITKLGSGSIPRILYAMSADRIAGRRPPFCAYIYSGETKGCHVYLISQAPTAFVGPAIETAAIALQPLLGDDNGE